MRKNVSHLQSNRTQLKYWRFFLISVLMLAFVAPSAISAATTLSELEYAIISTAIRHGLGNANGQIIIDESTMGHTVDLFDPTASEERRREELEELATTALALREWSQMNRERSTLAAELSLGREYVLLPESQRKDIFTHSDPAANWQAFHTRFPDANGVLRVSRPGIDDLHGVALLFLEFECGAECGSGRLINLRRNESGDWVVSGGTLIWITSPP